MARGRMIVTAVAIDRRLNALSLESQLLFLMTIPHLDRDGLIAGDAELLAGKVIPRRQELHAKVPELVQEWLDAGLTIAYAGSDTLILFFPGFRKSQLKMQYDREGISEFPPPPGYIRIATGLTLDTNKSTLAEVQSDARPVLDKITVNLTEVKSNVNPTESKSPHAATVRAAYEADNLMMTKTHRDAHLETLGRVGIVAWQAGWKAAQAEGKQNVVNYVARCAESAMLVSGNGHSPPTNEHVITRMPSTDGQEWIYFWADTKAEARRAPRDAEDATW